MALVGHESSSRRRHRGLSELVADLLLPDPSIGAVAIGPYATCAIDVDGDGDHVCWGKRH